MEACTTEEDADACLVLADAAEQRGDMKFARSYARMAARRYVVAAYSEAQLENRAEACRLLENAVLAYKRGRSRHWKTARRSLVLLKNGTVRDLEALRPVVLDYMVRVGDGP